MFVEDRQNLSSLTSQVVNAPLKSADSSAQVEEIVMGERACLQRRGSHPSRLHGPLSDIYTEIHTAHHSGGGLHSVVVCPAAGKHFL